MFCADRGLAVPPLGAEEGETVNSRKKMILTRQLIETGRGHSHCFHEGSPPCQIGLQPLAKFLKQLSKGCAKDKNLQNGVCKAHVAHVDETSRYCNCPLAAFSFAALVGVDALGEQAGKLFGGSSGG